MLTLMGSLFLLLIIGVPVAWSLGVSSLLYFLIHNPSLLLVVPQRIFAGFDNMPMVALPLYILMGMVMNDSGLTAKILDICDLLVGRLKGGLACINVLDSMFFGGISGSSAADVASLGAVMIPAMKKRGYDVEFIAGITAATATMGIIIPPSIPMLLFATIAEQSVGKMFLGGVIPGVLVAVTQLAMCLFISYRRDYPQDKRKYTVWQAIRVTYSSLGALLLPVFVVGSVVMGVATVSESAACGLAYALILGLFITKGLKIGSLPKIFLVAMKMSATVMVVIACSQLYIWVLSMEKVPELVTRTVSSLQLSREPLLIVMMVVMLIVGTFMDVSPAIMLLTPVFLPAAMAVGVEPVQFGALLVAGMAVGMVTPPVGTCLNITAALANLDIVRIFRGALPFLLCNVFVLILICLVPAVTTFIPSLFFK
jgi:tripartite ATP-independent transporter DctM subunit